MRYTLNIPLIVFGVLSCFLCAANTDRSSSRSLGAPNFAFEKIKKDCIILEDKLPWSPGSGYDVVKGEKKYTPIELSFKNCTKSADGKYWIADEVLVDNKQRTDVDVYSMQSSESNSSRGSQSMRFSAAYKADYYVVKFEAKTSKETVKMVQSAELENVLVIQSRVYYTHYKVRLNNKPKLHSDLKARLVRIAQYLQVAKTTPSDVTDFKLGEECNFKRKAIQMALHLVGILLQDFGTHYEQSVTSGAVLTNTAKTTLNVNTASKSETDSFKASAKLQVYFHSAEATYSKDGSSSSKSDYAKRVQESHTDTYGGPAYEMQMTPNDWQKGIRIKNMVVVSAELAPIYTLIQRKDFREFSTNTINAMRVAVEQQYRQYISGGKNLNLPLVEMPNDMEEVEEKLNEPLEATSDDTDDRDDSRDTFEFVDIVPYKRSSAIALGWSSYLCTVHCIIYLEFICGVASYILH